jgi:hypothetical protein
MIIRILLVAPLALMLSGCVTKERFRYVHKQDHCFAPEPDPVPPSDPNERRPHPSIDCRSALYKTGFVEFDQNGGHIDPAQARKVLALIAHEKARVAGGKVITLVYVHGWKNNGDQAGPGKMKDVERFTTALNELGERARMASPANPVPIVGVYIGWKGKSLMGPGWFSWLSYWARRNTANRIGGETLAKTLNDIIDATTPTAADNSRVLFVGHSFGARVLEHAVESGVKLYEPEVREAAIPVRTRVDLVLYVNAANDARLSMGRLQQLQSAPIAVRHPDYDRGHCAKAPPQDPICKAYPLIVAITSRGDQATKFMQPVANRIGHDGNSAPNPQPVTGTFLDETPSMSTFRRSAPGHLRFMHSHVVTEVVCPVKPGDRVTCAANDPSCAFAFRSRGESEACFKASVRVPVETKKPFNETAFWIMDVDTRVVKDHGDIWNLSMLNMLGELMAPRGFFEPGQKPMRIQRLTASPSQ